MLWVSLCGGDMTPANSQRCDNPELRAWGCFLRHSLALDAQIYGRYAHNAVCCRSTLLPESIFTMNWRYQKVQGHALEFNLGRIEKLLNFFETHRIFFKISPWCSLLLSQSSRPPLLRSNKSYWYRPPGLSMPLYCSTCYVVVTILTRKPQNRNTKVQTGGSRWAGNYNFQNCGGFLGRLL